MLLNLRSLALCVLILGSVSIAAEPADFQAGLEAYERGDYAVALREWRPLAEQGDADAQSFLGLTYAEGKGVPQDYIEAAKWYRKAAEQGHASAQYNLGVRHDNGEGVPQDDAEAVKWYCKAAEQGDVWAQNHVGTMYANGAGVPQDDVQAYAWYNIAAAQGNDIAENNKKLIAESMTREQRARAQELAREYWKAFVLPFRN